MARERETRAAKRLGADLRLHGLIETGGAWAEGRTRCRQAAGLMSAVDPHGELWYTRHQQSLNPELQSRDARLRHSVSRDVTAACVEARASADWRVDTGKTIARHRIDVRLRPPHAARCCPA